MRVGKKSRHERFLGNAVLDTTPDGGTILPRNAVTPRRCRQRGCERQVWAGARAGPPVSVGPHHLAGLDVHEYIPLLPVGRDDLDGEDALAALPLDGH